MNGKEVRGNTLVVKFADTEGKGGKGTGTPSPNIFIKGIPPTMNEEQLFSYFAPYGKIVDHAVLRDRFTRVSKCQAFVHYEDEASATSAISAMNGFKFPGATEESVVRYADTPEERAQRKSKKMKVGVAIDFTVF